MVEDFIFKLSDKKYNKYIIDDIKGVIINIWDKVELVWYFVIEFGILFLIIIYNINDIIHNIENPNNIYLLEE